MEAKSTDLVTIPVAGTMEHQALVETMSKTLYPGASQVGIALAIEFCRHHKLSPILKPCHIVPMYDRKSGEYIDQVMPGIGLYRTLAARTGCAGITEPEFGPMITKSLDGVEVTFPEWARVTVSRIHPTGMISQFTAREYWMENYATRGGKERSIAPNAMWAKRVYGQLGKCAEAQALRKAFPEVGALPVLEEMQGKEYDIDSDTGEVTPKPVVQMPKPKRPAEPAPATQSVTIEGTATVVVDAEPTKVEAPPATQNRPISAGALDMIRRAAVQANKGTEADLCKQFLIEGGSFDQITEEQFKKVLAYLRAAT